MKLLRTIKISQERDAPREASPSGIWKPYRERLVPLSAGYPPAGEAPALLYVGGNYSQCLFHNSIITDYMPLLYISLSLDGSNSKRSEKDSRM